MIRHYERKTTRGLYSSEDMWQAARCVIEREKSLPETIVKKTKAAKKIGLSVIVVSVGHMNHVKILLAIDLSV